MFSQPSAFPQSPASATEGADGSPGQHRFLDLGVVVVTFNVASVASLFLKKQQHLAIVVVTNAAAIVAGLDSAYTYF